MTTPHPASVHAPTAYLWPTSSRYELLGAIGTLLDEHRFPYNNVHSVELELANAELLEPFHPLFLLLSSLRSVSLRVSGPIVLGREMYNRLRMLRSTVTTLGIHYAGPSDPDTSPDSVFVNHIVCSCSGAIQGTSVLPDMSWVQTLLLRLPDITVRPVRLVRLCMFWQRFSHIRAGQAANSAYGSLSAPAKSTHRVFAGYRPATLRLTGTIQTRCPRDAAVL